MSIITPTPRELNVLVLVVTGYSNKQIAALLGTTQRTVETHLTHIYQKLEASGRGDVLLKALKADWINPKDEQIDGTSTRE